MKVEDSFNRYKENFYSNWRRIIILLSWLAAILVLLIEVFTFFQLTKNNASRLSNNVYIAIRIIIPTVLNMGTLLVATLLQKSQFISCYTKNLLASIGIFMICSVLAVFHSFFIILLLSLCIPCFCCTIFGDIKILKTITILTIPVYIIAGVVFWLDGQTGLGFYKILTLIFLAVFLVCAFMFSTAIVTSQKNQLKYICSIYKRQSELVEEFRIDPLTRLYNRVSFDESLNCVMNESDEEKSSYIVMMDIDYFKKVNDKYGHVSGDKVLVALGDVIRNNVAAKKAFRFGGEEFVLLFEKVAIREVVLIVEKIREEFLNMQYDFAPELSVTLSAGISKYSKEFNDKTWLESADKALYYAKEHGRNQIKIAEVN